jgi:hypothetical protein
MVAEGYPIYGAASDFPYGAVIGAVRGLRDSNDKLFREAGLTVHYNTETLHSVLVAPPLK